VGIGWKQNEPVYYMRRIANESKSEEICDKYRVPATVRRHLYDAGNTGVAAAEESKRTL